MIDRLVRLGLPVKCNTNTNEKFESTKLLKKINSDTEAHDKDAP